MNSIDKALDPDNFGEMDLPAATQKTFIVYLGPQKRKNVEKVLWTDVQPEVRGRQRQCDILGTRVCFPYILDTVWANASTVLLCKLGQKASDVDSFELGWNLAEALVVPFAKQRNFVGLSKKTMMKLSLLLGDSEPIAISESTGSSSPTSGEKSTTPSAKRRCLVCISQLAGSPGYKAEKDKLPKLKSTCKKCAAKTTCAKHLVHTCLDCS